jgi:hypothetical protein
VVGGGWWLVVGGWWLVVGGWWPNQPTNQQTNKLQQTPTMRSGKMNFMSKGCGLVGMLLFLGIFVTIGIGLSLWGWTILQQAQVSQNWPTTSGEVTYSQVRESSDEDGTSYFADVTYGYVANDRRYTSDNVSFGQYGGTYKHASGIVERYPVGQRVTVSYNPEEPQTAVLEPGATWSSYMILFMGFMFAGLPLLIGMISVVTATRRR